MPAVLTTATVHGLHVQTHQGPFIVLVITRTQEMVEIVIKLEVINKQSLGPVKPKSLPKLQRSSNIYFYLSCVKYVGLQSNIFAKIRGKVRATLENFVSVVYISNKKIPGCSEI